MKQEDKELLLLDLCTRLPYGVHVDYKGKIYDVLGISHGRLILCKPFMSQTLEYCPLIEEVNPYLLPLSSITVEQIHEFNQILGKDCDVSDGYINIIDSCRKTFSYQELNAVLQFLNKNHFDYRGLIEKGLAIEAPEGMYN